MGRMKCFSELEDPCVGNRRHLLGDIVFIFDFQSIQDLSLRI